MKVAVVGGGWAGLSAALTLRQAGVAHVSVFEAGPRPGGRARRIDHPDFPAGLDNGQHILLGAYRDSLALIEHLASQTANSQRARLHRYPLHLESLDGHFRLHAPGRWPAPLNVILALASARGLSLAARGQAVRLMLALRRWGWQVPIEWSVDQLLARLRQGSELRQRLWHPLCLAALNTPVQQASAALFARILRDGLAEERQASDLLLPGCDLGELWPDAAIRQVDWRPGNAITAIEHTPDGWRLLRASAHTDDAAPAGGHETGAPYDALILAVPPPQAARLLHPLPGRPGSARLLQTLAVFDFEAIATLNLKLAAPWQLPFPMMQLDDQDGRQPGHWIFDRANLTGRPECGELSIVGSVAGPFLEAGREALAQAMDAQWRRQWQARTTSSRIGQPAPAAPPATLAHALVVEKRATFSARPGLARPGAVSPWPGLYLAGDWTDTGYPGVLEGAVRSGQEAARRLLRMA
ncbi:hydroxysqualene dehydroxylase HpnE [Kerstersia gyiorum]|uniref:Squalene-associated FAD-dependent desaturase n=1 Tax=Kerstersia gyiorum TaxID=206506 RepID=A0A171KNN9_9BURK|nr:hydroxysqualene dehydroxylase HpnE [Kerstersia gyiorum]MCO7640537.1 hydroxysqualene dehydroxylase HpnE [Pseudomonas sp. S 311-6]KAB0541681.1 NAD(P)-binding protein [Kerstersia gyiorum]KKO70506.1 hypothetical protein AAV32_15720 [Kerstersia gyiorum]MCP1634484.1 squalene-associated FAD-dependent desaturase [Kerstersia gyiorum]MCP1637896.1 squalene-associated FAD-dependent desaturase [Kerstersia gyiorum]